MKFYYVKAAPADRRWQKTQADAKAQARESSGEFKPREVPTDAHGLGTFLNAMEFHLIRSQEREQPPPVVTTEPPSPIVSRAWEATDIADFILSRATVAQVESIFSCVGTRFKELANAAAKS